MLTLDSLFWEGLGVPQWGACLPLDPDLLEG